MEQNKKTAVDWLIEKINSHDSHDAVILNEKYFSESKLLKYLQVAKQMETQNIVDAFIAGDASDCLKEEDSTLFAQQYYNQNYETETNCH